MCREGNTWEITGSGVRPRYQLDFDNRTLDEFGPPNMRQGGDLNTYFFLKRIELSARSFHRVVLYFDMLRPDFCQIQWKARMNGTEEKKGIVHKVIREGRGRFS